MNSPPRLAPGRPVVRGQAPSLPPRSNVVPLNMVREDQLAADILRHIAILNRKLDSYLGLKSLHPLDESNMLVNDAAVEWMRESLEDLAATLVGIEMVFGIPEPGAA